MSNARREGFLTVLTVERLEEWPQVGSKQSYWGSKMGTLVGLRTVILATWDTEAGGSLV